MSPPAVKHSELLPVLLTLAVPVLLEESLNILVGFTDRFLAGWFLTGPEPQAAMGMMAYAMWLIPCFFSGIGIGATALVARNIGAGNPGEACRVLGQALWAGSILAVAVTIAVAFGGDAFIGLMGLEGEARRLAATYLSFLAPVIPVIMLEQVGSSCLRGAGDTVTGLYARAAVNIVNVVLSAGLVSGWGPFPHVGWSGLAIGTACGHGVGGLVVLVALLRGSKGLRLTANQLRPDFALLRRIFRVGLPGGADVLAVVACHLVYVRIITGLGTIAMAAHSLGLQIEAISYLSGSAFQVAAATMAGQALGAADEARAKRSVILACGAALLMMCSAALLFYFAGEAMAACFTGGRTDVVSIEAGRLLKIVAIGGPPLAVLIVLSGALRGSGDTAFNLAITFAGLVGLRLPLAVLFAWKTIPIPGTEIVLSGLDWGVAGAWTAMVIDVTVRSILTAARFAQGGWTKIKV